MVIKSEEFIKSMLDFFPSTKEEYRKNTKEYYEGLDTVIIEDIFMPELINILGRNENIELIRKIFKYFEEVSCYGDDYLINIFSITVLEKLGDDREILEIARQYMGTKTTLFQIEADRDLGRIQ